MPNLPEKCDNLLITLRKIIRAIDLHSKQLEARFGLTGPQMLLLKSVCTAKGEAISSSQLAASASLSQATVTSIMDRLVQKGYVYREKSQTDKRKTLIHPTEKAEQVFAQNPGLLQERFVQQFAELKDWEQSLLLSSLQRIADMMDAEQIDTSPVLANAELQKSRPE